MLQAQNISIVRDGRFLLEDVSLRIDAGEVVAVIGPNGAGKTTLIRTLSGEWKPDEGEVLLSGRPLEAYDTGVLARRRAVLGQDLSLAFPFTAFEIGMLGRTPFERICSREKNESIVKEALEQAEVRHLAGRLYPTLSGGERQRVQLARVLAQIAENGDGENRYMLMDEPTANQDLAHQHQLLSLVRRHTNDRVGVVIVLHDLNLAARYADRLVLLSAGKQAAQGTPSEILTAEIVGGAFGVEVQILQHPLDERPLVVASHPDQALSTNDSGNVVQT